MSGPVPIYLDHAATTPLDPRVLDAMLPFYGERFGNAASRQHRIGRAAAAAVEAARAEVAALLGADPREIVFTSGATEANNLALKGVAFTRAYERAPRHVVTVATEHRAVLDPLRTLEEEHGFRVTRLGVDALGHADLDELASAVKDGARLVSVMHANNETGVLHPLEAVGALCREHGALFHTDATQTVGKEPLDVAAVPIDLLSASAHKLYGPQGVGALYVRRKGPRARVRALIDGGGHEGGRRSGTLAVALIVGFGEAARIARAERETERERVRALRDGFEARLLAELPEVERNGDPERRLAGHANLSFAGVDAESLFTRLATVCASSSSACTSAALQPSHVLRAHGFDAARIAGSVRFSLGRTTTPDELERAVAELVRGIRAERAEGPRDACGG